MTLLLALHGEKVDFKEKGKVGEKNTTLRQGERESMRRGNGTRDREKVRWDVFSVAHRTEYYSKRHTQKLREKGI